MAEQNVEKCKFHPEQDAKIDKHGRSTGMCGTCLTDFGRRGAEIKWNETEAAPEPEINVDSLTVIPAWIADAVMTLARPGAEHTVLQLLVSDISLKAAALVQVMAGGRG